MRLFGDRASVRHLLLGTFVVVSLVAGCSSTPSAPTPPPPPPPNAPQLACSDGITRGTVNNAGIDITYTAPTVTGGQTPVNVTCSPESGSMFPIGRTTVTCRATDGLQREASCMFDITVNKIPEVSRVKYMAFGDSIVAGEVTFPVSTGGGEVSGKQVIVPSAAFPTVLERLLRTRYQSQADQITVSNQGWGGERAADARPRFLAAMATVQPEVVMLLTGHNDIPSGADGAASAAAREVRIMAAEAKARGARVFIATPVPGRPGGFRMISPFLLEDYAARMRDVAHAEGAVLVDLYLAMREDVFRYIGLDGLHPNEAGYERIAELFFEAIQRELEVR